MGRVSSCNRYAVQQDTKSVFNEGVFSGLMLARHVSDLTGPSSGAFLTSCVRRLVCGNRRTARHVQPLRSCRRSETRRANISAE